jgi:hypothetical protein
VELGLIEAVLCGCASSGVTGIATHGLGEASQTTINTTTSAVTHTATTTTEVSVKNEFRASKKSKWDMATNH